jgi:hypothetical protein
MLPEGEAVTVTAGVTAGVEGAEGAEVLLVVELPPPHPTISNRANGDVTPRSNLGHIDSF